MLTLEQQLNSCGFWILRKVVSIDLAREAVLWNQLCSLWGTYVGKCWHLDITTHMNMHIYEIASLPPCPVLLAGCSREVHVHCQWWQIAYFATLFSSLPGRCHSWFIVYSPAEPIHRPRILLNPASQAALIVPLDFTSVMKPACLSLLWFADLKREIWRDSNVFHFIDEKPHFSEVI